MQQTPPILERKYQEAKVSTEFFNDSIFDKALLRPIGNEKFSWLTYKGDDHRGKTITFQSFNWVPNWIVIRVRNGDEETKKDIAAIFEINKNTGKSLDQYEFWKADFDNYDFMENMVQVFYKLKTYKPLVN